MMFIYTCIFSVAAVYKLNSLWMGFDLGVHEQVLWNTMHGRIAEVSPFGGTRSYFGIDIILVELLLTPFYALYPHTETMLIIQALLASTGAIPLFLLARDRTDQSTYGLLAALLYFASLPVQYAILYEFQIRTIGTVLFLWAFLFFERKQFWLFLLAGVFAIWTRSEGGFALAAIGVYALIHRRAWYWAVIPGVVGVGWVLLCLRVLIPAFRDEHDFLYSLIYAWMGNSPTAILHTLLFRQGYIAEHVLTWDKLGYMLELFTPLLFLPLLRPDILLIAAPSLLINLLSLDRIHWSIRYHYQAFVVPFLLIATVYAVISPSRRFTSGPLRLIPLVLVLVAVGSQLVLRSPLINLATRPRDIERIATAYELMRQVPEDAALSVTSTLGPHMARRRELYFFPGNVIYPPELADQGEYLLADLREVPPEGQPLLQQVRQSNDWHTLIEKDEFVLMQRVVP